MPPLPAYSARQETSMSDSSIQPRLAQAAPFTDSDPAERWLRSRLEHYMGGLREAVMG